MDTARDANSERLDPRGGSNAPTTMNIAGSGLSIDRNVQLQRRTFLHREFMEIMGDSWWSQLQPVVETPLTVAASRLEGIKTAQRSGRIRQNPAAWDRLRRKLRNRMTLLCNIGGGLRAIEVFGPHFGRGIGASPYVSDRNPSVLGRISHGRPGYPYISFGKPTAAKTAQTPLGRTARICCAKRPRNSRYKTVSN